MINSVIIRAMLIQQPKYLQKELKSSDDEHQFKQHSCSLVSDLTYSPPLVEGLPQSADVIDLLKLNPPLLYPTASLFPNPPPCPPDPDPNPLPELPLPLLLVPVPVLEDELEVYVTLKLESLIMVTSVNTLLSVFSMSMMVAESTPSDDSDVAATQSVKVTLPKSANAINELPSSKSSTIHSAFSPPSAEVEVNDLVTVLPVVRFSIVADPVVLVVAFTYNEITCG